MTLRLNGVLGLTKSCTPKTFGGWSSPRRADRCRSAGFDLPLFRSVSIGARYRANSETTCLGNTRCSDKFSETLSRIHLPFRINKADLTMRGNNAARATDYYVIDKTRRVGIYTSQCVVAVYSRGIRFFRLSGALW